SIVVGRIGDRLGRRRLYAALLALMGAVGVVFAFAGNIWVLAIAALTGTLSTDPNESGPITTLEQAMIGQAPAASRVRVFGRYNAVAYLAGAVGALAAGGPDLFRRIVPALPADRRFLLAFPLLAALCLLPAWRLSPVVDAERDPEGSPLRRPLVKSRRNVLK